MHLLNPMENYEGVDEYSPIDSVMMVNSHDELTLRLTVPDASSDLLEL